MKSDAAYIIDVICGLDIDRNISPRDQMFAPGHDRHYFAVGRSAAHLITTAGLARSSFPGGSSAPEHILDYGCGHGRVARWLRAMFPDAQITGMDYIAAGVDWCVERFNYIPHLGPVPKDSFDLIWLGSVFTHLPEDIVRPIIDDLKSALRPSGVLVFTTQGRHSARRIERALATGITPGPWLSYNLPDDIAANLVKEYNEGKYSYADYPGQQGYGVTIAPISWYTDPLLIGDDYCLLSAQEKAWDTHQDVVTFIRADIHSLDKGILF